MFAPTFSSPRAAAFTLTLEVESDPTNPYIHIFEARDRSHAIRRARAIIRSAPKALRWTVASLRDKDGVEIWGQDRKHVSSEAASVGQLRAK